MVQASTLYVQRCAVTRAPWQILVLPFRAINGEHYEYALFQRTDEAYWQGIAGGGEEHETPLAAAKREAFEEAHIPASVPFFALQTTTMVPVSQFAARHLWPKSLYVIPTRCYAADCSDLELSLSEEHTQYTWLPYLLAMSQLRWDSDKTALWELHERLRGNDLPPPV